VDGSDRASNRIDADDLPRILKETERRIKTGALGHWLATNTLESFANWFTTLTLSGGFLVSLLAAIPIVLPAVYNHYEIGINLGIFILAGLTSILSVFQTVFRWSERAQVHRSAASHYTNARRQLEVLLIRTPCDLEALEVLLGHLTHLSDTTPSVPSGLWKKAVHSIRQQS
jgi:hypothetical protein